MGSIAIFIFIQPKLWAFHCITTGSRANINNSTAYVTSSLFSDWQKIRLTIEHALKLLVISFNAVALKKECLYFVLSSLSLFPCETTMKLTPPFFLFGFLSIIVIITFYLSHAPCPYNKRTYLYDTHARLSHFSITHQISSQSKLSIVENLW